MRRGIRELVSYRLAALVGRNDRSGHAHMRETFGLTLGEWRVLGNIAADEPITFAGLAGRMLIDKGQLSRTVAALVDQGRVASKPSPDDGRGVELSLTAAGRTLAARVLAFAVERNAAMLTGLAPAERRALSGVLTKLELFVETEHAALSRGDARSAEAEARAAVRRRRRPASNRASAPASALPRTSP